MKSRRTPDKTAHIDGRHLRTARTKRAIIEAYLKHLRVHRVMPTVAQIAQGAGVSTRTIFQRFTDLRSLTVAAVDCAIAQGPAEAVPYDVDGDRPARIRSHLETRARAGEKWLPLWRIVVGLQNHVSEIEERIAIVRFGNITQMKLMYEAELSHLATPERNLLLIALATLVSLDSWYQMRNCHGLSVDDAQNAWRFAIDRLLPPTPGGSRSPEAA